MYQVQTSARIGSYGTSHPQFPFFDFIMMIGFQHLLKLVRN